jgi:hypothetical protein
MFTLLLIIGSVFVTYHGIKEMFHVRGKGYRNSPP